MLGTGGGAGRIAGEGDALLEPPNGVPFIGAGDGLLTSSFKALRVSIDFSSKHSSSSSILESVRNDGGLGALSRSKTGGEDGGEIELVDTDRWGGGRGALLDKAATSCARGGEISPTSVSWELRGEFFVDDAGELWAEGGLLDGGGGTVRVIRGERISSSSSSSV